MKKLAIIFTSLGPLVANFTQILKDTLEDCELIRIADDSLIRDVQKLGAPDENITERTFCHIEAAVKAGADMVVIACSSVGELAPLADAKFPVPVIRIDSAMMDRALEAGDRIGVIATLQTTIGPTVGFLEEKAKAAGKAPQIISRVAEGAYQALNSGKPEVHDELVTACAKGLAKEVDVIILAQGSMGRLGKPLSELLPIPVLTSPDSCALAVKEMLK